MRLSSGLVLLVGEWLALGNGSPWCIYLQEFWRAV